MKTKVFIFVAIACAMVSLVASVGCVNKSNAQSGNGVGDELTLNLCDTSHGVDWTDSITGTPNANVCANIGGGYWSQTYNDNITSIQFGEFVFSHLPVGPGASFGGSYWDGFTTGSNGDTREYVDRDSTGQALSACWVANQWGVMAGNGIKTCGEATRAPYLIAYWGYYMEPEYYETVHSPGTPPDAPMHCLTVQMKDNNDNNLLFAPLEVQICNHPWPYYGNINGDGFAKPIKEVKCPFILNIHGLDADSALIYTVTDTLAVYDPSYPDSVRQSSNWHSVDLQILGQEIKTLYFTMDVPDEDPTWGPNTAVYFCLGDLKVEKQGIAKTKPVAQKARTATTAKVSKNREVTDYFPLPSYTGGDVTVYDKQGKVALQTTVKAGEKINLSQLPEGEYRLRHGHRHISFKKVK
jgi:hypothetical protein